MKYPWLAWLVVWRPDRIEHNLQMIAASGRHTAVPNVWQMGFSVLRMWHRLLFRPETIGTCRDQSVRPGWRAGLLRLRPLRFPFLLWERAIAPLAARRHVLETKAATAHSARGDPLVAKLPEGPDRRLVAVGQVEFQPHVPRVTPTGPLMTRQSEPATAQILGDARAS